MIADAVRRRERGWGEQDGPSSAAALHSRGPPPLCPWLRSAPDTAQRFLPPRPAPMSTGRKERGRRKEKEEGEREEEEERRG